MDADTSQFRTAQTRYAACSKRIAWLNHPDVVALESVRLGYNLARLIAWVVIMGVAYMITHQVSW
jgi:hypothetical protein